MWNCPKGHHNLAGFEFCGECGSPLEEEPRHAEVWYRAKWAIVGAAIVAVIVVAGVAAALAINRAHGPAGSSAPTSERTAAIQGWWSGTSEHVEALQDAVADTQLAIQQMDDSTLEATCRRMHDLAAVDLRAHLPSPDPDVTSELQAAVEDAHQAAHMCLAAAAGTVNSYVGEFSADLDQAQKHLATAENLIEKESHRPA